MKLLLLILTITFSQIISAQLLGTYSDVPASEYEHDVQIQAALYYGAWDAVVKGIQGEQLPPSTFEVSQIIRVQQQLVAGLNFQFDVELSNGEMTATANYEVYSEAGTSNLQVISSSLSITSASNKLPLPIPPEDEDEEEDDFPGDWDDIPDFGEDEGEDEFGVSTLNSDSNLRDILNFGVQNIISKEGKNFNIEGVVSIEKQDDENGTNYIFNVVLRDDEGNENAVKFTVKDPLIGEKEVTGYEFIAGGESPLGDWESIDASTAQGISDLDEIRDYGVSYVVVDGIFNDQLSEESSYEVSETYSIKRQLVEAGVFNYRFNVKLTSPEGEYAKAVFVVNVDSNKEVGRQKNFIEYYFYDIQNAASEEANEESSFWGDDGGFDNDDGGFSD